MSTPRPQYPLVLLCRVLNVSRSGYYAWRTRRPSIRAQENARLEVAIHDAHVRTRQTYGPERLQAELCADGFPAGVERIKRLRKIKDLFTCEVVGHTTGARMTTDLVRDALRKAVRAKHPRPGLIHHSDRDSQYCALTYQDQLHQFGMTVSMSRRGNCYDNAPMESFWGTLKNERVHHRRYEIREQARREISEDIEIFYNRQRRHSRLGNRSPVAFAQRWARQQPAA